MTTPGKFYKYLQTTNRNLNAVDLFQYYEVFHATRKNFHAHSQLLHAIKIWSS